MKCSSIFAVAVLLVLAPACFVSRDKLNTPLNQALVAKLVPGTSTADDVLDLLGAPTEVVQLGRRSAWRYDYSQGKRAVFTIFVVTLANNDIRQDRVWVFFDEADSLIHVGGTYEARDARYKMPFQN